MSIKAKYNSLNESQKSIVKMLGILLSIILIFLIIILIIAIINGGKKSNEQIELIMERAAEKYVNANPTVIKDEIYGNTEIDVNTLAEGKYMKPFTKYYGKETLCTGKVIVYKNLDYYDYIPKIDCGENYQTKSLSSVIVDDSNITTKEAGLYRIDNRYVYRGEYVDNYVSFENQLWRIIDINENGEIKIFQDQSEYETVWDDRFNSDYQEYVGINSFENVEPSRIKATILDAYNNMSNEVKSKVIPKEYCIGKRNESDASKDGSSECNVKTELMGASGIIVSDYLMASLDPKCNNTLSTECENYNYMANLGRSTWTVTADSDNTKRAYAISNGLTKKAVTGELNLRLVITINGNINYSGGTGTVSDPYIIR